MQTETKIVFKFILIGNSPVGKSALLFRYLDNVFMENLNSTIGVDFISKQLEFDSKTIKLQIWDTAGQEKYMNLLANYFKGVHGIFLVYDVTKKQSFIEISKWMEQIKQNTNPDVPKILVGNKSDLNGEREVTPEEGQQMANTLGLQFIETSAKEGFNVERAFLNLLEEALAHHEKQKKDEESQNK